MKRTTFLLLITSACGVATIEPGTYTLQGTLVGNTCGSGCATTGTETCIFTEGSDGTVAMNASSGTNYSVAIHSATNTAIITSEGLYSETSCTLTEHDVLSLTINEQPMNGTLTESFSGCAVCNCLYTVQLTKQP